MIHIVALAKAVPGKEVELEVVLKEMVTKTRKEEGCIQYDLHEDTGHPGLYIFIERWTSEKALHDHLNSAHIQDAMKLQGKLYQSIEIKSLRPVA